MSKRKKNAVQQEIRQKIQLISSIYRLISTFSIYFLLLSFYVLPGLLMVRLVMTRNCLLPRKRFLLLPTRQRDRKYWFCSFSKLGFLPLLPYHCILCQTVRSLKTDFTTNSKIYNTWYFRLMPEALELKNRRPVRFSVFPFLRFSDFPIFRRANLPRFPMSYRLAVFCIRSQILSICSEIGALVCQLDRSRTILLKHVQNHVF